MTRLTGFARLADVTEVRREDLGPAFREPRTFARLDRATRLLALAVERALAGRDARGDTAVVLGSVRGCAEADAAFERTRALPEGPSPALFPPTLPTSPAAEVSIRLGLEGPVLACSAGEQSLLVAVALGVGWLERGDAARVLACELEVGPERGSASVCVLERDGAGPRLVVDWRGRGAPGSLHEILARAVSATIGVEPSVHVSFER